MWLLDYFMGCIINLIWMLKKNCKGILVIEFKTVYLKKKPWTSMKSICLHVSLSVELQELLFWTDWDDKSCNFWYCIILHLLDWTDQMQYFFHEYQDIWSIYSIKYTTSNDMKSISAQYKVDLYPMKVLLKIQTVLSDTIPIKTFSFAVL